MHDCSNGVGCTYKSRLNPGSAKKTAKTASFSKKPRKQLYAQIKVWKVWVDACLQACAGCARCRYVSASPTWSDCSWAHDCNRLRRDVSHFRSGTAHGRAPLLGLSSDKWRPPSCQLRRSAVQSVNATTRTLGRSCVVKRTYHPSKLELRWWRNLDGLVDLGSWRKGCVRMQQNKRFVNEWSA